MRKERPELEPMAWEEFVNGSEKVIPLGRLVGIESAPDFVSRKTVENSAFPDFWFPGALFECRSLDDSQVYRVLILTRFRTEFGEIVLMLIDEKIKGKIERVLRLIDTNPNKWTNGLTSKIRYGEGWWGSLAAGMMQEIGVADLFEIAD